MKFGQISNSSLFSHSHCSKGVACCNCMKIKQKKKRDYWSSFQDDISKMKGRNWDESYWILQQCLHPFFIQVFRKNVALITCVLQIHNVGILCYHGKIMIFVRIECTLVSLHVALHYELLENDQATYTNSRKFVVHNILYRFLIDASLKGSKNIVQGKR